MWKDLRLNYVSSNVSLDKNLKNLLVNNINSLIKNCKKNEWYQLNY